EKWRAWDLAHVEKSYVMWNVWNNFDSVSENPQTLTFLSLAVGVFRFSIDPGPKESDFIVENLSTAFFVNSRKDNSQVSVGKPRNVATVETYTSSLSLRLR